MWTLQRDAQGHSTHALTAKDIFLLKTSREKEKVKKDKTWRVETLLFCTKGKHRIHRYDLQLKGPEEETFGPEALCQRGSFRWEESSQIAQCQQLPPVLPPQRHKHPCTCLPKDFVGFVPGPLFVAVPVFASSCLGPCKGCKQHSSAHLSRLLSTPPQNTYWRLLLPGNGCPIVNVNHFPRKQTQRDRPPTLLSGGGTEMSYGTSLWQHMCGTRVAGATEAFLKWQNMSKTVECDPSAHKTREPGNVTIFVQMVLSGCHSLLLGSEGILSVNRFLKSKFHQTVSGDH